jgi:CubicO group peptidase (beta-lactamase class C family)
MHVMAVSRVLESDRFWGALKAAYGRLPQGGEWTMAVASTDGTRAVNVIAGAPIESVRRFFEEHTGAVGTTECFEVDAGNAVGLPKAGEAAQSPERQPQPGDLAVARRASSGAPARGLVPRQTKKGRWRSGVDTGRIVARLSDLLAAYQIPSAQVGVLRDGHITDIAVGVRDVRSQIAATTDTIYQLGSMTKTWTALAFMQLADEGKVALDEPVRTYLPGFRVADPEVSARLTPRQLLNHTNGIEEFYGDPGEDEDVYERMVANLAEAPQVFPLGDTHGYSAALGYAILARVMEVVDGRRWDAIARARLFEPLGLRSTSSWRGDIDRARAATGHVIRSLDEGPSVAPVQFLPRSYGAGGNVSSTARDVLTMASLFLNGGRAPNGRRILSAESTREMTTSRVPVPDPFMFGPWWALGLIVCDWHGETVYAHDGSTIGQDARLRILPERNLAIAMLTNAGPRESFHRQAFNAILADLGALTVPELPEPDPAIALDLARYTGTYQRPGVRYEVDAAGGRLHLTKVRDAWHARVSGRPERTTYQLLPVDETHFLMPSDDPLEDTHTLAIYGGSAGAAQYLHTNCRVHPRATSRRR